jgi:hypothetical protein
VALIRRVEKMDYRRKNKIELETSLMKKEQAIKDLATTIIMSVICAAFGALCVYVATGC